MNQSVTYRPFGKTVQRLKKLLLHPTFYPALVLGTLIATLFFELLAHPTILTFILLIITFGAAFFIRRFKRITSFAFILLLLIPVVLTLKSGETISYAILGYLPTLLLFNIGQQNKKISSRTYLLGTAGTLAAICGLSIFVFSQPLPLILTPQVVAILILCLLLVWINELQHRVQSYYLTIEDELKEKIGATIIAFSNLNPIELNTEKLLQTAEELLKQYYPDALIEIKLSKTAPFPLKSDHYQLSPDDFNDADLNTVLTTRQAQLTYPRGNSSGTSSTSLMGIPLVADETLVGLIRMQRNAPAFFSEKDVLQMQIVASICVSKLLEISTQHLTSQALELAFESQHLQGLDELKALFIKNLSQDIQVPLQLILSTTAQLERGITRPEMEKKLRLIRSNSHHLKGILDQVLELGQIDINPGQFQIVQFDFAAHIRNWAERLQLSADQKNIALHLIGPDTLPMESDLKKMSSIVHNLIQNAIRYTPENGKIEVNYGTEDNNFILHVHDSGPGIPKVHRQQVFERFYRLATTETSGTGIGLSIVYELTQAFEGSITINDSYLGGAHFTFSYPYNQFTTGKGITKKNITLSDTKEKPTILIVDDYAEMRQFILSCLEDVDCITAKDGQEALEVAQKTIPDLIITDLMMPNMSGEELCKAIRNHHYINHIPIIVLTAKTGQAEKLKLYQLGADNFITKPFDPQVLRSITCGVLHSQRELRHLFCQQYMHQPDFEAVREHDENTFIQQLITHIEAHLDQNGFGVLQLCRLTGIGRNQMQRKVKAITGMTPLEFIRHTRLKKAALLLEDQSRTVADVALAVGFNNHSYFSRQFKAAFGCYPSAYMSGE